MVIVNSIRCQPTNFVIFNVYLRLNNSVAEEGTES